MVTFPHPNDHLPRVALDHPEVYCRESVNNLCLNPNNPYISHLSNPDQYPSLTKNYLIISRISM